MSNEIVQSVQRAFYILQAVSDQSNGIGVSAIAAKTGLHTSTVSRLITTLENVNALSRVDGGSQLILGEGLIDLVSRAPWTERMIALTRPFLRQLADQTRESVGLTRLDEQRQCHVFFQIESQHHVRIRDWTGHRFPLHVTSSGKLWMAEWDAEQLQAYFANPLEQAASQSVTTLTKMQAEFGQIRKEGAAWTVDELEDGLLSIAVPIKSLEAGQLAAIYLSAPVYRFTKTAVRQKLAQQMRETAEKINKAIEKT